MRTKILKFKKSMGKSGHMWLVGVCDNPSQEIYVSSAPQGREGNKHFMGHNGRTIEFRLEDGGSCFLQGPWHSNASSFFNDTGKSPASVCQHDFDLRVLSDR